MPIDASIPLQVKQFQLESPINQLAKAYEMGNAMQANQLGKMTLEEKKRALAEQESLRNYFAQTDMNSPDFVKGLYRISPTQGTAFEKSRTELEKNRAELGKTKVETASAKQKFFGQAVRDLQSNPSNENITAWAQDGVRQGLYTPEEAGQIVTRLTSIPEAQRQSTFASFGATAGELKPHIQTQDLGGTSRVLSVPAFGGAPTVLSSATKTVTPGEVLSAATTRRGQDLTNTRELKRIAIEKGKNSPEYIAMKAEMEQQGKQDAKFKASAPAAISKAEEALRKIDEMVGSPAVKDKSGKVIKAATGAHPGLAGTIGVGVGARFIPGTSAADFQARLDEIQGGAFLEAYETLKGGGAITEVEGKKATQAITRMSTSQSEVEFVKAARELQNVIKNGLEKAKSRMGKGSASTAADNVGGAVDTSNPLLKQD